MDTVILTFVAIAAVAVIFIFISISRLLLISQPNEVIILSGRKRSLTSGDIVGYRIIRGGRALRIPLIEKASRMSLETIPIDLSVKNAYSKGGIPLVVEAIANIKIDSKEPAFGNAVERFLTMTQEEIHRIAKDTLEGNLRGVLASLTPEEVNQDRMKFAESLMEEAETDLQKLGLQLDTLKITNISDERGYLDSIGRMKTAELIKAAEKAEADNKAEAEEARAAALKRAEIAKVIANQDIEKAQIEKEKNIAITNANKDAATEAADAEANEIAEKAKAKAKQEIETAQINAEQNIAIANSIKQAEAKEAEALAQERAEKAKAKAKQEIETAQIESEQNIAVSDAKAKQIIEIENNNYRIKKAELDKEALIKENEARISSQKAAVMFEQEVEQERISLQQKKLIADVIEPSKAKKEAMELEAKGKAATIIADGEAKITIINQTIKAYSSAGSDAEKVFILNILPQLVEQLSSTVKGINIDKISIIDSNGNGTNNLAKLVNQLPGSVVSLSEMIENATGVDILSHFKKEEK